MAFSAAELANIANSALDFYLKGQPLSQTIQDKPLLKAMEAAKKTFPGGKELISGPVKGSYNSYLAGYEHDDQVTYTNPANDKRVSYAWKQMHGGLAITMDELKRDGISVVDTDGKKTVEHSEREKTALINILESKMEDMTEGIARNLNAYFWGDGSGDAKGIAGVQAFLTATPAVGTTGGIDRAANTWWRHRAPSAWNTSSVNLATELKKEMRQLNRFGGKPNLMLAGSAFIEAMEAQLYAKGDFTQSGFSSNGKNDMGIADISYNGMKIQYDPTLDDLSKSKYLFVLDTKAMFPYVMQDEWGKTHNPARPYDRYVIYRGITYTGNLYANRLNSSGVYQIA